MTGQGHGQRLFWPVLKIWPVRLTMPTLYKTHFEYRTDNYVPPADIAESGSVIDGNLERCNKDVSDWCLDAFNILGWFQLFTQLLALLLVPVINKTGNIGCEAIELPLPVTDCRQWCNDEKRPRNVLRGIQERKIDLSSLDVIHMIWPLTWFDVL